MVCESGFLIVVELLSFDFRAPCLYLFCVILIHLGNHEFELLGRVVVSSAFVRINRVS